jgi:hypothetical protein
MSEGKFFALLPFVNFCYYKGLGLYIAIGWVVFYRQWTFDFKDK